MAEFTVNPTRHDPYKNFKFRVKWDGEYVPAISRVTLTPRRFKAKRATTRALRKFRDALRDLVDRAPGAAFQATPYPFRGDVAAFRTAILRTCLGHPVTVSAWCDRSAEVSAVNFPAPKSAPAHSRCRLSRN